MRTTLHPSCCLAAFVLALSVVSAAVSRGNGTDPAHPGKCVYKDIILEPVQTADLKGECCEVYCQLDLMYSIHCCGVLKTDCPLKENKDAEYPECCPQPDCPDGVKMEVEPAPPA